MPKERGRSLEQLRDLVQDLELDDYFKSDGYLIRWLQYANYDVQKSANSLRKSSEWRKRNKIDLILGENFDDLVKRFPINVTDFDKDGRILVRASCKDFDCKNLNIDRELKRILRFAYWNQLKIENRIKEQYYATGKHVSQGIAVLDCSNMTELMKEIGILKCYSAILLVKQLVSNIENNFPRGIAVTYVINAPKIFTIFYSAIKHIFCAETANTFQVHGTESTFDWKAELCTT